MHTRFARQPLWAVALGLAVAYFATARLGLALALPPDFKATAVWPPSGIALAALVLLGPRVWLGVWTGAFTANLWDAFDPDRGGPFAAHLISSAAIATGSTLQALAGAALIRRFVGPEGVLARARDAFRFVTVVPVACLLGATVGVSALGATGLVPWAAAPTVWWTWWVGDTVGALVIAPVVLCAVRCERLRLPPVEAVALFVLLIGCCAVVFGGWGASPTRAAPLGYLSLPFLVWAAIRFGPRGAALAVVLVAAFAVWGTVHGTGPFVHADVYQSLILLDVFLAVVVVTSLVLGAVLRERETAEAALRASEAKFRQLSEALPQIVWSTAPDGTTTYLNRRWTEYTGLTGATPDELAQTIHPDDLPRLAAAGELAQGMGTAFQEEFRLRPVKGGAYRWFLARSVPVVGADGVPGGRLGTSTDIDDLKQAQAELTRQRVELQLILDTVPALIFFKDRNHRLVRVNNELVRLLGLPYEAIVGRTDSELGSPHADDYRRQEEEIMRAGALRTVVEPLHTFAGTRWLQTTKLPYRDEAGQVTGILGFSVDITEQKSAEDEVRRLNAELEQRVAERTAVAEARALELQSAVEALREQKQLLQTILDSLGEAVLVAAKDGRIILRNRAFQRLHAEPAEHTVHSDLPRLHGVYLPDGSALCPADQLPIARAVRGESCDDMDLLIVDAARPDGVPIRVTGRPILGPSGVEGGVIAIRDVSAARRSEAALRASEERFALAVRGSRDGIWDWNLRTEVVYYSPQWKQMLGYAEHEVAPRVEEWERLVHPDDLPGAKAALSAYFDRTADAFGLELRMRHKDGTYRWIYTRGEAQFGPDGRPDRMGGSHTDVTDRKEAEAALRASQELLDSFFEAPGSLRGVVELVDGDIVHLRDNAEAAAFFGRSPDEMRNRRASALGVSDEAIRVWSGHYRESRRLGNPVQFEFAVPGAGRWLRATVSPLTVGTRYSYVAWDVTARRAAEAALRESEQRFRAIFDQTFQFIGLMSADGTVLEANRTALAAAGVTEADVLGKPFWETVWWTHDPVQQARLRAAVGRAAAGEMVRFEATHPAADGSTIRVDFSLKPFRDHTGAVNLLIPEGRDITAIKRAAEELAATEALMRQFIKYAPAAIAMLDTEMRYVQASDRWLTDYRLSERDIIGRSHYEVFPDIPDRWKAIHRRVLAGAVEACAEDPFPRADGSTDWLQWECRPWRAAGGEIGGIIMFTQVVTDRIRAAEALRESEERFRTAFDYAAIGMAVVSTEGRWLKVNPALCQMLGYAADELLRIDFQTVTHPDDLDADLALAERLLRGELTTHQMEKRYLHKSGNVIFVLLAVSLVRDGRGGPLYYVAQIKDITERKRSERALRESEERFRAFMDNSPAVAYMVDEDGRAVYLNEPLRRHFGVTDADWLGKTEHERFPADVARAMREKNRAVFDAGEPVVVLETTPAPDGALHVWQSYKFLLAGADGRRFMGGLSINVTAEKRAEAALRESEERFRIYADHSADALFVHDTDGRVVDVNRQACESLGYNRDELIGRLPTDFDPCFDAAGLDELNARLAAGETVAFDSQHQRKDGARFPVEIRIRPFGTATGLMKLAAVRDITERERAGAALRASEERYRETVEAAPDAIVTTDAQGTILSWNGGAERVFGWTAPEVVGRDVVLLMPPRYEGEHAAALAAFDPARSARSRGRVLGVTAQRKDGGEVPAEIALAHWGAGADRRFTAIIRDVTERKRAEHELRVSEERFRVLFEHSSDAHLIFHEADGILDCNRAAVEMLRYPDKSAVLARHPAVLSPEFQPDGRRSLEKCVEMDATARRDGYHRFDWLHRRADGETFPCEVTLTPVVLDGRTVLLTVWHDLTERKRAEAALRASEALYRAVVEALAEGVVVQDRGGAIVACNNRALEILGLTRDQIAGRTSLDPRWRAVREDGSPFPGEEHPAMVTLRTGTPQFNTTMGVHTPGGALRWISINAAPVPGADPAGTAVVCSFHDVTAVREANDRLRASVREKEAMLKEIHHRVKNNLQIISTLLDLQSDGIGDPAALAAFRESRGRVRSMSLIHERLYRSENLASVEFGAYLRGLADDLFRAYRADDEAIALEVTVSAPPLPLDVAIPCGLLVNELISNCLKYAFAGRERGIISVSLESAGAGTIVLTVADDGVGLPAGFDFRNTPSFGLQLVNTLAAQLHGEIALGDGTGARFIVRFPVRG